MAQSWCKVASDLDHHPRIRRAGRNAREVFLFALRRNAGPHNPVPGYLPAATFDPWYLSDQLLMTEAEAIEGLNRCESNGLLIREGATYRINGWDDDEWGRPLTNAERQSRFRAKQKGVTNSNDAIVTPVTRNAGEERRGEEKVAPASGAKSPKAPPGYAEVIAAFDARYESAYQAKPTWNSRTGKQVKELLARHSQAEVTRRIDILFSSPPAFLKPPFDIGTLVQHFDKLAQPASAQRGFGEEPRSIPEL